jgi:hypothetical protein
VVDPQAAGAGDRGADRLDERLVVGVAQPPGDQRRGAPVLALGVEGVRRGADADALGQHVLPGPGVGAAAGDADRQVLDDGHALGRRGELQVQRPLQPGVEGDDGAVLLDVVGDAPAAGRRSSSGQACQSPPCSVGDRAQVAQSCSVWPCSSRQRAKAGSPPPWASKIRMQHLALAGPDRVAVDELARPTAPGRRRPRGRPRRRRAPRRPAGRAGCGSAGWPAGRGWPPARVGATACSGLISRKPAPWSAAIRADRAQVGEVADAPAARLRVA